MQFCLSHAYSMGFTYGECGDKQTTWKSAECSWDNIVSSTNNEDLCYLAGKKTIAKRQKPKQSATRYVYNTLSKRTQGSRVVLSYSSLFRLLGFLSKYDLQIFKQRQSSYSVSLKPRHLLTFLLDTIFQIFYSQ